MWQANAVKKYDPLDLSEFAKYLTKKMPKLRNRRETCKNDNAAMKKELKRT